MQLLRQFLLRVLILSFFCLHALGQNSVQTFGWRFRTDFLSVNLPSCFNFSLVVFPNPQNLTAGNYSGTPPYYMMAFPEGGQPLTTLVGVDNNTLSWLPQHPIGTRLILQMVDSLGNTGGTGSSVYEVVQTAEFTNCVVPAPSQDFRISSNVTRGGTLETCQPWRINIDGGHPPYTAVLDARNSPVMTNVTIPATDNAMVYINRAAPGTDLFVAVVDSFGRWATGTQYVSTVGSTNVTCTGLGTTSFNQSTLDQQEAARWRARNSGRRTSIIIGVVVSLVSLLSIVGAAGIWYYLRRKRNAQGGKPDQFRQFDLFRPIGQVFPESNVITAPSPRKSRTIPVESQRLPHVARSHTPETLSADNMRQSFGMNSVQFPTSGANLHGQSSSVNPLAVSVRRSKGQEAVPVISSESRSFDWPRSSGQSMSTHNGTVQGNVPVVASENEVVYQHRDAGQVVRELPPPYILPPETG